METLTSLTSLQISFIITIPVVVILAIIIHFKMKSEPVSKVKNIMFDCFEIETGQKIYFYHNESFYAGRVVTNFKKEQTVQVLTLPMRKRLNIPYMNIVEVRK